MQYHLSCYDCGYETPEDNYYVTCPKCKGFLEVTLDRPLEERVFLAELPSIFKYQHFMPYSYEPGYDSLENFEATPDFVDAALSERLDVELVVKDETVLPTGTWKDREGFVSIHRLVINDIDDLTIFSAGNTAASLARSATLFKGPRVHMVIPYTSEKRIEKFRHSFDFYQTNAANPDDAEPGMVTVARNIDAELLRSLNYCRSLFDLYFCAVYGYFGHSFLPFCAEIELEKLGSTSLSFFDLTRFDQILRNHS